MSPGGGLVQGLAQYFPRVSGDEPSSPPPVSPFA